MPIHYTNTVFSYTKITDFHFLKISYVQILLMASYIFTKPILR